LRGISGAAILGDGQVGLILEMAGIYELHNKLFLETSDSKRLITDAPETEQITEQENDRQSEVSGSLVEMTDTASTLAEEAV
jgi:chemotaxis protein histidine kinase CheA